MRLATFPLPLVLGLSLLTFGLSCGAAQAKINIDTKGLRSYSAAEVKRDIKKLEQKQKKAVKKAVKKTPINKKQPVKATNKNSAKKNT